MSCTHENATPPARPVPDWTGRCPDCGEGVKHDGRGGFITVRENNDRRLARDEHNQFVSALTRALSEAGVPAMPSWPAAIDYLVSERDEWKRRALVAEAMEIHTNLARHADAVAFTTKDGES